MIDNYNPTVLIYHFQPFATVRMGAVVKLGLMDDHNVCVDQVSWEKTVHRVSIMIITLCLIWVNIGLQAKFHSNNV